MYRQVIVAVDGDAATAGALEQAVAIARGAGARLTGVFVPDGGWPDFIGNDWQSAKGARQGFLDHIRKEQEEQAEAAHRQFEAAAAGLPDRAFSVRGRDPTEELVSMATDPVTDLLVVHRRVFQVSGRPSLKSLAATLAKKATRPLLLVS